MFKIGDRVVGVSEFDGVLINGQLGTVIDTEGEAGWEIKVEFDTNFSSQLHGLNRRCWWVDPDYLRHSDQKRERKKNGFSKFQAAIGA